MPYATIPGKLSSELFAGLSRFGLDETTYNEAVRLLPAELEDFIKRVMARTECHEAERALIEEQFRECIECTRLYRAIASTDKQMPWVSRMK